VLNRWRIGRSAGALGVVALALLAAFACCSAGRAGAAPRTLQPDPDFGQKGVDRVDSGPAFVKGLSFSALTVEPDGSFFALRTGGSCCGRKSGSRPFHFTPAGRVDSTIRFPVAPTSTVVRDPQGRWLRAINRDQVQRLGPDGHLDHTFDRHRDLHRWGSESVQFTIDRILPLPSGDVLATGGGRVARLRPDGSLDPDFGDEGTVELGEVTGGWSGKIAGLLAVGDRTIVLANAPGAGREPQGPARVLALDPGGHLDPAFAPAEVPGAIVAFTRRADGGVGFVWRRPAERSGEPPSHPYVTMLGPDGVPDPRFGSDGTAALDPGTIVEPHAMLFMRDGSIAVGGEGFGTDRHCWTNPFELCDGAPIVVRLAEDGAPATGFGVGGASTLGGLPDQARPPQGSGVLSLAEGSSGDLLAAGGSGTAAFVAHLDADGAPVAGFGAGGIAAEREPRPPHTSPYSAMVDSRGRILVGVESDTGSVEEGPAVLRFLPDGRLDRSFGQSGVARLAGAFPSDVEVVPDGSEGVYVLESLGQEFWLTHLDSDGRPVRRFGIDGSVRIPLSSETGHDLEMNHVLARLPGGGLVVAGGGGSVEERAWGRGPLEVRRLSPDGHLVRAFGHDGVRVLDDPRLRLFTMLDLSTTPGGGILVSGSVKRAERTEPQNELRGGHELAVAKIGPRGALDPRFGHRGIATPRVRGESAARVVLGEPDGSVLVGGLHVRNNPRAPGYAMRRPLLLRLRPDGSVLRRYPEIPTSDYESSYEAKVIGSNMSNLIVAGGKVLAATRNGGYCGGNSLLAYSLRGRPDGYLPVSRPHICESIAAVTGSGRRLIVATVRMPSPLRSAPGFTMRAFRVR
jgi:uncharacterized delta-60 repeat protein